MGALPEKDKTWLTDFNNQVALDAFKENGADDATRDMKTGLLGVKNALVASGKWSVLSSCGGNNNASGFPVGKVFGAFDYWIAARDLMWGDADTGVDHAWIVLYNSVLDLEMCLDCVTTTGNDGGTMTVAISRPTLNGGGFTGGALDERPTAVDEILALKRTTSGSWGLGANDPIGLDFVWNTWVSDDGESTMVVFLHNDKPCGFWLIGKAKNPTDVNDVFVKIRCEISSDSSDITYAALHEASTRLVVSHRDTLLNTHLVNVADGFGPQCYITSEGFNNQPCGKQFSIANQVDGDFGIFASGVASTWTPYRGRHGEFFDLHWGVDTQPNATTHPSGGAKTFIQFGHMIFHWDGSTPITA